MAPTRHCARCGGQNPADGQFCIECGAGLNSAATGPTVKLSGVNCAACGALNPERSQFCCICGRMLAPQQPSGGTQPMPGRHPRQRVHPPIKPPSMRQPPQRSYPRVHLPPIPAPIPPAPLRPPHHRQLMHNVVVVPLLVVFVMFSLITTHALWPMFILFSLFTVANVNGRPMGNIIFNAMLLIAGMVIVATTGFWPVLFVLFCFLRRN